MKMKLPRERKYFAQKLGQTYSIIGINYVICKPKTSKKYATNKHKYNPVNTHKVVLCV